MSGRAGIAAQLCLQSPHSYEHNKALLVLLLSLSCSSRPLCRFPLQTEEQVILLALNTNTNVDFPHLEYVPLPRKSLDRRQTSWASWLLSLSRFSVLLKAWAGACVQGGLGRVDSSLKFLEQRNF